jgi:hypothetical protein
MESNIKFSFLRLFDSIKGIHKPEKKVEENWLTERADKKMREKFENFFKWCKDNGVESPKIKYPVLFGEGDNQYPGMLATEDIGKDEMIIKVPANMVLSTRVCFNSDIKEIFFNHPDLFGMHMPDGEDNVLATYVMYELGKGEKSFWQPMFEIWPKDTEIMFNWDDADLEWL